MEEAHVLWLPLFILLEGFGPLGALCLWLCFSFSDIGKLYCWFFLLVLVLVGAGLYGGSSWGWLMLVILEVVAHAVTYVLSWLLCCFFHGSKELGL